MVGTGVLAGRGTDVQVLRKQRLLPDKDKALGAGVGLIALEPKRALIGRRAHWVFPAGLELLGPFFSVPSAP